MQITQNLQPTLQMAFTAAYNRYLTEYLKRTPEVYGEETINTLESEQYWLGDIPGIRRWVTARTYQQLKEFDRKLTSVAWTTEGFRYNRVQNTGPNVAQLTGRMSRQLQIVDQFPDEVCVKMLANGGGSAATAANFDINGHQFSNAAFDDLPFFSSHASVIAARGYSNVQTLAGTSLANVQDALIEAMALMAGSEDNSPETDTGHKVQLMPDLVLAPFKMYLLLNQVIGANTDVKQNNFNIRSPLQGMNLRTVWSPHLKGNGFIVLHTSLMRPVYWQTTNVEGRRVIMDVDDTQLAAEGWYGIASSIWGMGGYGFPWSAIKVSASDNGLASVSD